MKKLVFDRLRLKTLVHTCGTDLMYISEAQEIFDSWFKQEIESAPVVYAHGPSSAYQWTHGKASRDQYSARLIMIEEIKKDCVKHEPISFEAYTINWKIICKHCGAELIQEWKVKP